MYHLVWRVEIREDCATKLSLSTCKTSLSTPSIRKRFWDFHETGTVNDQPQNGRPGKTDNPTDIEHA